MSPRRLAEFPESHWAKVLRALQWVGLFPLIIYSIGVAITVPYFNYLYAHEHGFLAWLFLGEVVATLKSLIWPYYVFLA